MWIKEKRLYSSQHSRQYDVYVHICSPDHPAQVLQGKVQWPMLDTTHTAGLYPGLGVPSFGNPKLLKGTVSKPVQPLLQRERLFLLPWKANKYTLKSRDITLPTKVHLVKAMVFPVVMYGCESWTVKKAEHQRIDAFELWCWSRLLRVPWTARRSNQSILKEISPGISLNDAKAETPVLWPPHAKSWLIRKDSDAGRDWGQEDKGITEDEMAGWHHWLDGCESEWTPGVGDGQGGLACCDLWSRKESDTTERLIWTELSYLITVLSRNAITLGITTSYEIIWILERHNSFYNRGREEQRWRVT